MPRRAAITPRGGVSGRGGGAHAGEVYLMAMMLLLAFKIMILHGIGGALFACMASTARLKTLSPG